MNKHNRKRPYTDYIGTEATAEIVRIVLFGYIRDEGKNPFYVEADLVPYICKPRKVFRMCGRTRPWKTPTHLFRNIRDT